MTAFHLPPNTSTAASTGQLYVFVRTGFSTIPLGSTLPHCRYLPRKLQEGRMPRPALPGEQGLPVSVGSRRELANTGVFFTTGGHDENRHSWFRGCGEGARPWF